MNVKLTDFMRQFIFSFDFCGMIVLNRIWAFCESEGNKLKYEVAFYSRNGGAARIARAISDTLPEKETRVVDLSIQKKPGNAETYLIGFDLYRETCPFVVLDAIESLEGKNILLFASSGFGVEDHYRTQIENQIKPFLPERCHYLGLYLCRGRVTEDDLSYIREQAGQRGGRINEDKVMEMYEESQSHPDMMDLHGAMQFVRNKLNV